MFDISRGQKTLFFINCPYVKFVFDFNCFIEGFPNQIKRRNEFLESSFNKTKGKKETLGLISLMVRILLNSIVWIENYYKSVPNCPSNSSHCCNQKFSSLEIENVFS